ncbi:hypothetical protein NX059_009873 [Plenodomus lindquistii]|nr:hypothetical protein NX059_009873 [Plenodomus lindquistii]
MQASIVEVLLGVVRNELVGDFVPLGALSVAIHATQVSYLWSLDFFSIFRAHALPGWRRALMIIAIPALVGLTSLVGPSSAVLMIPRPGSARTVADQTGTRLLNGSLETLYPSRVGENEGLSLDLTAFNTSLEYIRPYEETYDSGKSMTQRSAVYSDSQSSYDRLLRCSSQDSIRASATIPTQFIANSFGPASSEGPWWNATISVVAAQPVVDVQCPILYYYDGSPLVYIKDNRTSVGTLGDLSTMVRDTGGSVDISEESTGSDTKQNIYFPPIWRPSPEPGSNSSVVVLLLGYVIGMQIDSSKEASSMFDWLLSMDNVQPTPGSTASLWLQVCTVSSYWNTGQVDLVRNRETSRVQSGRSSTTKQADFKPIILDLTGPSANTMRSTAYAQYVTSRLTTDLLAISLAVALSQIPGAPSHSNDSLSNSSSSSDTANQTAFDFTTTEYGFGYGTRTTSVYLSITVLLAYCVIAISYIIYTLITGVCSTAWNSGIELVALALQSKKPDHLGHTAVGIDSIKTFSESVGVRVNTDNELELVFAHDRDLGTRDLRKLVRNTEY